LTSKKVEIIEKTDAGAHTTSMLMTIYSERSFSGAKFNDTSRNNEKAKNTFVWAFIIQD